MIDFSRGCARERGIHLKTIRASLIRHAVKELCIAAATALPRDVLLALENAFEKERSPGARDILAVILENARMAETRSIPLCQDTGMVHVFLELGQDVCIEGDLKGAVCEGVSLGYFRGYLRKSVVRDPLYNRDNTGDNAPPVIYLDLVYGSSDLKITLFPKGTGSENKSRVAMLMPSAGVEGVKDFVVQTVKKAGPDACPPFFVGVGVGGMMDHAAHLAKVALLRPLGAKNPDPKIALLEREILYCLNSTGIGPGGLGGDTTALAVSIETYPTHIGALPVAVNLQCHAARRAAAVIEATPQGGKVLTQTRGTVAKGGDRREP